LDKDDDAREYEALHRRITEVYRAVFIHQDGRIRPEKQASYVRALAFDLVPPALQRAAVEHLVRLIRENGDHLGTGFLSTPFLCHVLSSHGQLEVAHALLKQDTMPSWLNVGQTGSHHHLGDLGWDRGGWFPQGIAEPLFQRGRGELALPGRGGD